MSLFDLLNKNGDKLVHFTKCSDEKEYVSVFNYSEYYGGTIDSFRYYNDYVIELKDCLDDIGLTFIGEYPMSMAIKEVINND